MVFLKSGHVVVEVFVKVGLPVLVEVVQACDLIAAQHVHLVIHDAEPKGLEKSRGKTLPGHAIEFVVDVIKQPHIAGDRTNRRALAAFEEVDATATDP